MEIYIEYVIFNNFCIDLTCLYLSAVAVRLYPRVLRLIIAALLGTAYAAASPFIPFQYQIISRLACLAVMGITANGRKKSIRYIFAFLALTFLLGGAVIGISNIFSSLKQSIFNPNKCYEGLLACGALALILLVKACIRRKNTRGAQFERKVDITSGKNITSAVGLYDSGNRLYYRGLYPVIAVKRGAFALKRAKGRIKVKTVCGEEVAPLFVIDSVKIGKSDYGRCYAIEREIDGDIQIILHKDMCGGV